MREGSSSLRSGVQGVMRVSSSIMPMRPRSESVSVFSLHLLIGRFLRKRLVGKTVHVLIDYIKPKEGDYEERECVTITYGSQNT
jgi:hypothetical protein